MISSWVGTLEWMKDKIPHSCSWVLDRNQEIRSNYCLPQDHLHEYLAYHVPEHHYHVLWRLESGCFPLNERGACCDPIRCTFYECMVNCRLPRHQKLVFSFTYQVKGQTEQHQRCDHGPNQKWSSYFQHTSILALLSSSERGSGLSPVIVDAAATIAEYMQPIKCWLGTRPYRTPYLKTYYNYAAQDCHYFS